MSVLSGAHLPLFTRVVELLNEQSDDKVLVTGGGIIPEADMDDLSRQGVGKLFGPGTPTEDIVQYIEEWVLKNPRH